jgi:phosphoglycolate phosphatase/putative hydrolase of the HAD superfamily
MKPSAINGNPFESVRGVVFDVDGTLYSQFRLRLRMSLRMLAEGVTHPNRFKAAWKMVSKFRSAQETLRRSGKQLPGLAHEQIRMAAESSGFDEDEVQRTVSFWMETVPLKTIPKCAHRNLHAMIEGLSRSGLKIGVFSDYPCEKKLQALGIRELMHAALCSTDASVGAFKPHPAGFRVVAESLGLRPGEVLYVGDRVEVDAEGAKASGMKSAIIRKGALRVRDGVVYGSLEKICDLLIKSTTSSW